MSPSLSFSLAPRPHRNPRTRNAPTARTQTCGAHIHPPHVRAHTTCASICPRRTCHRTRPACMCFVPRRATASWASALPTALIAHLAIALAAKRGGARMSCEASAWPTRHQCDCAASACCHFSAAIAPLRDCVRQRGLVPCRSRRYRGSLRRLLGLLELRGTFGPELLGAGLHAVEPCCRCLLECCD